MITVFLCFFLSGIAGLMYQVLWIRQLSLIFGTTSFAVSTVLAAFMGGLALGSFWFGKIADRRRDHLRIYALLEIGIAVYCLLLPFLFKGVTGIYTAAYHSIGENFYLMSLLRFAISSLLLVLPATFMGATLPVLSRFVVRRLDQFGSGFGKLYGLNTFGAMIGCFSAGYLLIGTVGVWRTTWIAAGLNVLVAVLAWRLYKGGSIEEAGAEPAAGSSDSSTSDRPAAFSGYQRILILAVGMAGAASLVYEVAWTRILALVLGSSVYAFSAMLTTFLLGIALGSLIVSLFADRFGSPSRAFVVVQGLVAISAMAITPHFDRLPEFFITLFAKVGDTFWSFQMVQFTCTVVVMLLPTILIGAALPLAAKAFTEQISSLGRSVGRVYASNTIGAILGSFLAGFVLIPLVGTQNAISIASVVNLSAALLAGLTLPRINLGARLATVGIPLVIAVLLMATGGKWDRYLLNAGLFDSPQFALYNISQKGFRDYIYSYDIKYFEEGTYANVAVSQESGSLFLQINGRTEASTTSDMSNQILVSQIPMLLHPDPRKVLVIGLGSGITFGSVLTHPVDEAECVEISPAVVRAARYFADWHSDVTRNPKAQIIMDDGRNYMLSTDQKYDVIISEPSKPWISGVSNLFTRESYEISKKRLNDRGLFCQWFHYYSMGPEDFKTALRTFLSVFPYAQIWNADNNIFMVGANEPIPLNYPQIAEKLNEPKVAKDLDRIGARSVYLLLGYFLFAEEEAREFVGSGQINTDDLPVIEFSTPKHVNSFQHDEIFDAMLELRPKYDRYPLVGHISHENGQVRYDLANLVVESPIPWQAGVANMVRAVTPASRLDENETGLLIGYRLEAVLAGPEGRELSLTAISRGEFSEDKLDLVMERMGPPLRESGAYTVEGASARWGTYNMNGRPMVAVCWYSAKNKFQYIVKILGQTGDDLNTLRDQLMQGARDIRSAEG